MIRGILLIFNPIRNWDKIAGAQRGFLFVLLLHLLPLMMVTLGLETWMIDRFGEKNRMTDLVVKVPRQTAIDYGATEFVLNLVVVLLGAAIVHKIGNTFHGHQTYLECFTLMAYGLAPLFYLHVVDGYPRAPTWVCFSIGILLSVMLLYQGMPRLLKPDPTKALGLYLTISIVLVLLALLVHLLAVFVLRQQLDIRFWETWSRP